jgi:hypothetical protein
MRQKMIFELLIICSNVLYRRIHSLHQERAMAAASTKEAGNTKLQAAQRRSRVWYKKRRWDMATGSAW